MGSKRAGESCGAEENSGLTGTSFWLILAQLSLFVFGARSRMWLDFGELQRNWPIARIVGV